MKARVVLFILGVLVWILINWPPDDQHFIVGIGVAALVSFLTGDLFTGRPHLFAHVFRYLWFLYYLVIFIWECLKANLDVAWRVIHPRRPLRPGIVKVKTTLQSETGLTFLANSITLTPGTLTVDIDREGGYLYVHWIYVESEDIEKATRKIVQRFERILRKIFE